jgi:Protein of unknown function (DUF2470)
MSTGPIDPPGPAGRAEGVRRRPDPAERARTVFTRTPATISAPGVETGRVLAHAVTAGGRVLLVVPAAGDLAVAVAAAPDADLSALVMVSDHAPVPLRRPVRAQLWLSGWVTPVPSADRRSAVLEFAEACPADVLLDVGGSATLLRMDLAEVVLGETGEGHDVGLDDFLAARPDPLAGTETDMLRHLDRDHPEFVLVLRTLLPAGSAAPDDVVRPLGVDRFGFRLRVERTDGHHDLRVPFPRPLTCAGQLAAAVRRLTCTARAQLLRRD